MARQPVSQFGSITPFGLTNFDHEKWLVQWFEEREKHKSLLSVEIHEPLHVGDDVSVVAISNKCSLDLPASTDLWGLCLVAESLTLSTAKRLADALSMLKNRQGLDAKQGLAFLVQIYLISIDELRAIRGDRATRGDSPQLSLLCEAPWEQFGAPPTRRGKLVDLKHRPLWQLETLLDHYWCKSEQYADLSSQGPDGNPLKVLWLTNPPEAYPPDEFDKIYPMKAGQTDINVVVENAVLKGLHKAGILTPAITKSVSEPDVLGKAGDFRHSSDFRSVSLRGEQFSLTPRQAQAIQILWEAHNNGSSEVGQHYILEKLDSPSSRLRDTFRNSPAWRKLVVPGNTKGTFRLNM